MCVWKLNFPSCKSDILLPLEAQVEGNLNLSSTKMPLQCSSSSMCPCSVILFARSRKTQVPQHLDCMQANVLCCQFSPPIAPISCNVYGTGYWIQEPEIICWKKKMLQLLLGLSPRFWVPGNLSFWVCHCPMYWSWWLINIYGIFGQCGAWALEQVLHLAQIWHQ